jgi:transposase InsO family protein
MSCSGVKALGTTISAFTGCHGSRWSLRQKRQKRNKAAQLRQPKKLALHINQIWSMDFVADNLFDGRKLRMLTVVDCYTRESLDIHVDQSLKGEDVVRVLNNIVTGLDPVFQYRRYV